MLRSLLMMFLFSLITAAEEPTLDSHKTNDEITRKATINLGKIIACMEQKEYDKAYEISHTCRTEIKIPDDPALEKAWADIFFRYEDVASYTDAYSKAFSDFRDKNSIQIDKIQAKSVYFVGDETEHLVGDRIAPSGTEIVEIAEDRVYFTWHHNRHRYFFPISILKP